MKVVSLFSGAGGLDLGFVQAGHEIVWANDLYADAVQSYKKNIGKHIVCEDIAKIPLSDIPESDIVMGGFPCQGFSVANTKRTVADERNALYLQLLRVVKGKKPKFFLAENVKGLLSLGKGEVLQMILRDFSDAGYRVQYRVLNSADYGVPQTRERVIIVGVRNDLNFSYTYPSPTHSRDGAHGLPRWVCVKDAMARIPDPDVPNSLPNHVYSKYKTNFNGYIGHRPLNPNRPAPTVTARGDSKGGVVVLPHPTVLRRMSCRELAAVQSFPLNYAFYGSATSVYRQIGNAVPPLMAKAIAMQFWRYKDDAQC